MEVKVTGLDNEGNGIAEVEGKRYVIPFSAPGDKIKVVDFYKKRRKLFVKSFELIESSDIRVPTVCKHFGSAGGCSLQHLKYNYQLEFKKAKLKELFSLDIPITPSPLTSAYRNRMDIILSKQGIGFRKKGSWRHVVETDECLLFGPELQTALASVRNMISEHNLSTRDLFSGEGFLRYLVIRKGINTKQLLLNLVTSPAELNFDLNTYLQADSIYWSINSGLADTSEGEIKKFWGNEYLEEKIDGINFKIHPNSFFQTNTKGAEVMFAHIINLVKGDSILDLYCGVGTIGIYLAHKGNHKVVGIDINPDSIKLAKINAETNNVSADFMALSDRDFNELPTCDTIIVDPPRAGLHKKTTELLLSKKCKQLIYVSCNPKTLKIDLEELQKVYKINSIQGFDMFPHTPHVEVIVDLEPK